MARVVIIAAIVVVVVVAAVVGVVVLPGILTPPTPITKVEVVIPDAGDIHLSPSGWTVAQGYTINDAYYNPSTINVKIGVNNTIRWTNQDQDPAAPFHTVTSQVKPAGASTFNLNLNPGQSAELTLTVPGTYEYSCTPHPWMGGRIIVES